MLTGQDVGVSVLLLVVVLVGLLVRAAGIAPRQKLQKKQQQTNPQTRLARLDAEALEEGRLLARHVIWCGGG